MINIPNRPKGKSEMLPTVTKCRNGLFALLLLHTNVWGYFLLFIGIFLLANVVGFFGIMTLLIIYHIQPNECPQVHQYCCIVLMRTLLATYQWNICRNEKTMKISQYSQIIICIHQKNFHYFEALFPCMWLICDNQRNG